MRIADYPKVWLAAFAAAAAVLGHAVPDPALPDWSRPTALVLGAAGGVLLLLAARAMRRHRTTMDPTRLPDRLVQDGVFGVSRNPMYLGDLLILAGLVLWLGASAGLVLVAGFALLLDRRFILREEARLRATFGPRFDAYAARTRRWC